MPAGGGGFDTRDRSGMDARTHRTRSANIDPKIMIGNGGSSESDEPRAVA
jgi:hypothetical protein